MAVGRLASPIRFYWQIAVFRLRLRIDPDITNVFLDLESNFPMFSSKHFDTLPLSKSLGLAPRRVTRDQIRINETLEPAIALGGLLVSRRADR